uniref:Peptidase_S9 domain-containing protein n=1 Tax=Echinostoma caproni TaxID=27848 RepID=A0A183A1F6_9TREM
LTGHLASLERILLTRVYRYWLTSWPLSVGHTYPIALSDFARGPAVQGAGWPTMDQPIDPHLFFSNDPGFYLPIAKAIRLEPTRSDLFRVDSNECKPQLNTCEWLVNPHTSNYLVGSASLASYAGTFVYCHSGLNDKAVAHEKCTPIVLLYRGPPGDIDAYR